jgi:hypothetical protein
MAKSAATMIAMAADEILMPTSAELGPIDAQFVLADGKGGRRVTPAQAIVDDVDRARAAINTSSPEVALWAAIVQGHPVGIYQQALNAINLSKQLVGNWLQQWMFAGSSTAKQSADQVVDFLGNHNEFLSHGRRVDIDALAKRGVKIADIVKVDPTLALLVERLWYAVDHTLRGTPVVKMWENSNGNGLFSVINLGNTPPPPAT